MTDLTELKDAWGPPDPPSPAAQTTARAALMGRIAAAGAPEPAPGRARWRVPRLGWLIGGATATAALAAAVVFAVVPGATPPERSPDGGSGLSSGQRILLAAATVAQAQPVTTGTYWHLKARHATDRMSGIQETWTAHDGDGYSFSSDHDGAVQMEWGTAIKVGGRVLTLDQLAQLPTDPAALQAWIIDSYANPSPPSPVLPGPTPTPPAEANQDVRRGIVAVTLTSLLYEVPAPPELRAAALRTLASMPNVTDLGQRDGGQALRIYFPPPSADKFPDDELPAGSDENIVVIDPTTSTLISTTYFAGTITVLTAEWTDEMPKVVTVTG